MGFHFQDQRVTFLRKGGSLSEGTTWVSFLRNFQNELGMSHVVVSLIYMAIQLVISLVMVYLIPNTIAAHWIYLIAVIVILVGAYVVFMKKYYHLHEEYLNTLK